MASKGKTGPVPESPKDVMAFNYAQMNDLKGFKGAKDASNPFKGYSARTANEPDKGPYGKLSDSGGGNKGNNVQKVNDGTMDVPKKSRPFDTLPFTKTPQGLYHPVRGEGPPQKPNN